MIRGKVYRLSNSRGCLQRTFSCNAETLIPHALYRNIGFARERFNVHVQSITLNHIYISAHKLKDQSYGHRRPILHAHGTRCMNHYQSVQYRGPIRYRPLHVCTCIHVHTCTLATHAIEPQQRKRVDLMLDCIVHGRMVLLWQKLSYHKFVLG